MLVHRERERERDIGKLNKSEEKLTARSLRFLQKVITHFHRRPKSVIILS
jgi:hypothetical protein